MSETCESTISKTNHERVLGSCGWTRGFNIESYKPWRSVFFYAWKIASTVQCKPLISWVQKCIDHPSISATSIRMCSEFPEMLVWCIVSDRQTDFFFVCLAFPTCPSTSQRLPALPPLVLYLAPLHHPPVMQFSNNTQYSILSMNSRIIT